MINNVYVFDVDGTITDSCTRMDPEFQTLFIEFCKQEDVYLITGSATIMGKECDPDGAFSQRGEMRA